jgi:mannose-6-phosphate isomerase-like protein (cupin superfamily)
MRTRCSLYLHKLTTESFYLRSGRLRICVKQSSTDDTIHEFELNKTDCIGAPSGLAHQMEALEDSELYEFSSQHFESDSYRLIRAD